MYERRKAERRQWDHIADYPLVDSEGHLVTHNRRRVVERRVWAGGDVPRNDAVPRELRLRFMGRDVIMRADRLDIGRQGRSDVVVSDPVVSRQHAWVERRGTDFVLTDKSRNGTFVRFHGEERVHRVHGCELVLTGPGVMMLGRDFNGHIHRDAIYFDLG